MSLETAFGGLSQAYAEARDAFDGLRLTAVEDQPDRGGVALVDWFADFAVDLVGAVEIGAGASQRGHGASEVPRELDTALRALIECQRARDLLRHRLHSEPEVQSRLAELRRFGRERAGEWPAWTDESFAALERCRTSADGLTEPLLVCWQDLAEELASPVVSIHTTSIGQQFAPSQEGNVPR